MLNCGCFRQIPEAEDFCRPLRKEIAMKEQQCSDISTKRLDYKIQLDDCKTKIRGLQLVRDDIEKQMIALEAEDDSVSRACVYMYCRSCKLLNMYRALLIKYFQILYVHNNTLFYIFFATAYSHSEDRLV